MARKTYNIRKGRRRAQGEPVNYPRSLIAELNSNRKVNRPGGRTKQGDTQE